ncbi:hypothetical protein HanRHA438_Chr10g0434331 [Helianthus annuus]|uniref:Uncharacterized protein n=1 Tax=Helianthus annuus TaxID=4232 RepID=A0A9K3HUA0_HELAN|nr:hypothetical protein HanXRQr2_Chr10g0421741 [Helianthus annuus]KAJ0877960.1 hypothetical protein HanRHA438_Chr10g0434331 [Helianthus annuus]
MNLTMTRNYHTRPVGATKVNKVENFTSTTTFNEGVDKLASSITNIIDLKKSWQRNSNMKLMTMRIIIYGKRIMSCSR